PAITSGSTSRVSHLVSRVSVKAIEVDLRKRHALLDQHLLHRLRHARRAGEVVLELRPAIADEAAHALVDEAGGTIPRLGRIGLRLREDGLEGDAVAIARQLRELALAAQVARAACAVEHVDVAAVEL